MPKILRIVTCSSVRLLSPSRWKPYTKLLRTEACSSTRSLLPSRQKPYAKNLPKDRNLLLGSITLTEQVETLRQKSLRREACFLVQSLSPSKWKPYTENLSKDRHQSLVQSSSLDRRKFILENQLTTEGSMHAKSCYYRRGDNSQIQVIPTRAIWVPCMVGNCVVFYKQKRRQSRIRA